MQCLYPVIIKNPAYVKGGDQEEGLIVPCGKCMACRISKTREWSVRMLHELDYHENSVFVTLTYAPENLPVSGSLDKVALQLFLKRLRKALEGQERPPIKYYACGEYGDETFRPHYHAIIFGLGLIDESLILKCWNLGLIEVSTVNPERCRYVAGYIQKKLDGPQGLMAYGKTKLAPFSLMSKGLGKQYVIDNEQQLRQKLGVTVNGVEQGLPRYYRKVLEISTEEMYEKSIIADGKVAEKLNKRGIPEEKHEEYKAYVGRPQHDANLRAKADLNPRNKV